LKVKEYRGFSYRYDLGTVKVGTPLPKKIGKVAKKWLEKLGVPQIELMILGNERYDPLSSGSSFSLFRDEEMLSPNSLDRIRQRDFDLIYILIENNAQGDMFKQQDEMEHRVLRELVHILYPETIGSSDKTEKIVSELLAKGTRTP